MKFNGSGGIPHQVHKELHQADTVLFYEKSKSKFIMLQLRRNKPFLISLAVQMIK
jgi:hypothetical protein